MYDKSDVGKIDSNYGGIITDISKLIPGTKFYVHNGNWYGEIAIDKNTCQKCVVCFDNAAIVNGDIAGKLMSVTPVYPDKSNDYILSVSVIDPTKYKVAMEC